MKKIVLTLGLMPLLLWANENSYRYQIDLTALKNDQLTVSLQTPVITSDSAYFSFPKMVPGTYSISDFGRFIENLQAFDANGKSISNTKIDANTWLITPAKKLANIQYVVNDTYDDYTISNPIFEPAGTNFEKDSNYILNLFSTLGYFDSKLELPFSLSITHAPTFYGSTSLKDLDKSNLRDSFFVENYHIAADNPILYCLPDTATVMVGNTEVLISIYSTQKTKRAEKIAKSLSDLLKAQGEYLGGVLPVDKYSFLIYMANHDGITGGFGALEHAYCSMYFLPEMPDAVLIPQLREIAAHEFFHIVTPLNIHSKEIQYFDYGHPKMSAHLWLYEGTTEYHAHAVQVKYGFTKPAAFLSTLREKNDPSTVCL
jgi:predicted metalloprotease with PDZ domain